MRLTILAVGRPKAGPDRELYERYAERIRATGKGVGLTLALNEVAESRAASAAARIGQESTALVAALGDGAYVALDPRGRNLTSEALAERIAAWRDEGEANLGFVIGGPDGLSPSIVERATLTLAFGTLTWPHQLARIMLAEQLYRTVTILSGHPYHRG